MHNSRTALVALLVNTSRTCFVVTGVVAVRDGVGRGARPELELLAPGEVALAFRVDPKTVTRWASAGRIGSIRTPGGHRRFRESEVREITQQMEEGALRPKPKVLFEVGESIKVVDGPFQDFNGTVEEVKPEKGKVRVLISIFGRATPVELDFVQVEKA